MCDHWLTRMHSEIDEIINGQMPDAAKFEGIVLVRKLNMFKRQMLGSLERTARRSVAAEGEAPRSKADTLRWLRDAGKTA